MNNLPSSHSCAESLPSVARTRSGIEYCPLAAVWDFRDGVQRIHLNFALIPPFASGLLFGIKGTLVWYFEYRAPLTARGMFHSLLQCLPAARVSQEDQITCLTPEHILNIRAASPSHEHLLGQIGGFLRRWNSLGLPGVGIEVVHLLEQIRLKRRSAGANVATMDPEKGPFTDNELEEIQSTLNEAYAKGTIGRDDFLLVWLFMAFGSRPVQLAALKLCDLLAPDNSSEEFVLNIPRAKQKGLPRESMKSRPLVRQIGEPLLQHINCTYNKFKELLPDPWQAPMFPSCRQSDGEASQGFEHHATASSVGERIIAIFDLLEVSSERLRAKMRVTTRRFRYTFGTRAAEEGVPELVLAEMMDHNYPDSVRVYTALTDRILDRLDRAMAMQMAPLAQAFKGKVIRAEDEATRANDPSSRIVDLRIDQSGSPIGNCGFHSFCQFGAPVACYTCSSFEPWLDGPHEAVLDRLLRRREQLLETTDKRIASINDRTILGVAQVIIRCRELKAKGAGNGE